MRISRVKSALAAFVVSAAVLPVAAAPVSAVEAFPGFDPVAKIEKIEKRTPGWFLSVTEKTPEKQFAYAEAQDKAGNFRAARRAFDALVREWPNSPWAPKAQLRLADVWALRYGEWDEAYEALDYLLEFYPRACAYEEVISREYKFVNQMGRERTTWFAKAFTSENAIRRRYERIVRRAPGAPHVPEAMMNIAQLRENANDLEAAVLVYDTIATRYPDSRLADSAIYREARVRMTLARKHAYNAARCDDTRRFLARRIRQRPDLPETEELKGWYAELVAYMAEDAWTRAKYYDRRQRTPHAAAASYEQFLRDYPDSSHAAEARERLSELNVKK